MVIVADMVNVVVTLPANPLPMGIRKTAMIQKSPAKCDCLFGAGELNTGTMAMFPFGLGKLMLPFVTLFLLFILWQGVVLILPDRQAPGDDELAAIAKGADAFARQLKTEPAGAPKRFAVANLGGDVQGAATKRVRERLQATLGWEAETSPLIRKIVGDLSTAVLSASSLSEIARAGEQVDLDVVILGSIESLVLTDEDARATLRLNAYDLRSGSWIARETVTGVETFTAFNRFAKYLSAIPLWQRIAGFVLFAGVFPLGLTPLIRLVLARQSNTASALLFAGAIAFLIAGALLASGLALNTFGAVAVFGLLACISAGYFVVVAERIAGRLSR